MQEKHKRIATFQKQMETDQAAMRADAPKPSRPHPHPVKKGVKASDTSNMTTAGGQEGAGIVANKAVGLSSGCPSGAITSVILLSRYL